MKMSYKMLPVVFIDLKDQPFTANYIANMLSIAREELHFVFVKENNQHNLYLYSPGDEPQLTQVYMDLKQYVDIEAEFAAYGEYGPGDIVEECECGDEDLSAPVSVSAYAKELSEFENRQAAMELMKVRLEAENDVLKQVFRTTLREALSTGM